MRYNNHFHSVLCNFCITQLIVFFYGKEYLEFILCSFIESYIGIVWVCKRGLGLLYDGVVCLFSIYVVIVSISLAVVYTECDRLVILATVIYVGILTLLWYQNIRGYASCG